MDDPPVVTPGQLVSVIVVVALAGGVYVWPSWLVRMAGPGTLWGLAASIGVAFAATGLRLAWGHMVPAPDYASRLVATWGPLLTWPLFALSRLTGLLLDGTLLALYGNMLRAEFYPLTPTIVLISLIVGAAVWIGGKSVTDVARNVQFWSLFLGVSVVALLALALPLGHDWLALTPSLSTPGTSILHGVSLTGYLWVQGETLMTFGGAMKGGMRQSGPAALAAVALGGALLVVLFVTVIAVLGPDAVSRLFWPIVYTFSVIVVRLSVVTHLGLFILFLWTVGMVMYLVVRSYAATANTVRLLLWAPSRRRWLLGAYAVMVVGVAMALQSTLTASTLLETVLSPASLYGSLALLVVSTAWARLRRDRP